MNVLLVQKIVGVAGSELYILELAGYLCRNGTNAEILILTNKKREIENHSFYQKLKNSNIVYHVIYYTPYDFFHVLHQINKIVKVREIDVVNSHLIHADFLCSMSKSFYGSKFKLVSTKHGYDQNYQGQFGLNSSGNGDYIFKFIKKIAHHWIDKSFAVSKGIAQLYIEKGIVKEADIEVIYPGFNFPQSLSDSNQKPLNSFAQLTIVGRLIRVKGHKYLIEACNILKERGVEFNLNIVGGYGDLENEILNYIDKSNLTNEINVVGHSNNVHKYIDNSDIIIVTSIGEGFGIVILEAFNSQKPVISFDVPACNEIIENGKSGFLIEPFDIVSLADKIEYLISNPNERKIMGINGRARLDNFYNTKRMGEDVKQFYCKVIRS